MLLHAAEMRIFQSGQGDSPRWFHAAGLLQSAACGAAVMFRIRQIHTTDSEKDEPAQHVGETLRRTTVR
jgi:hypothetical protein